MAPPSAADCIPSSDRIRAMHEQQETEPKEIEQKAEITIAEYDQALDIAEHTDVVIHEVAAIIWGANTLLLGFILEVDCGSSNQRLVVLTATLGKSTVCPVGAVSN
jgi:hypothetical protein